MFSIIQTYVLAHVSNYTRKHTHTHAHAHAHTHTHTHTHTHIPRILILFYCSFENGHYYFV